MCYLIESTMQLLQRLQKLHLHLTIIGKNVINKHWVSIYHKLIWTIKGSVGIFLGALAFLTHSRITKRIQKIKDVALLCTFFEKGRSCVVDFE